MDHVDWLDVEQARVVAQTLSEQVVPGGIVIWRSAAMTPPYAELIKQAGFDVRCMSRADQGYQDR
jgi:betaine lipid synthase